MLIDAALLESMPVGLAAFRHYAWLEPAATFGYAQHYTEVVAELTSNHAPTQSNQQPKDDDASIMLSHTTITRRLTGGGIVDHRNDWTYALIIHASLNCTASPATDVYRQIHQAIRLTLKQCQIDSQLAPCPRHCDSSSDSSSDSFSDSFSDSTPKSNSKPSQCFKSPAVNDVLRPDGKKIAGAAMKRSRQGLLIQGSIDRSSLPETFDFTSFQSMLLQQFSTALNLPTGELEDIRPLFKSELIEREKQRFAGDKWNHKR